MRAIIFAILVVLILCLLLRCAETLATYDGCGHASEVSLPYDPLVRYDFVADRDSVFADIRQVAPIGVLPEERHRMLATTCDETPGCVAFNSSGMLKYGVLPPASRKQNSFGCPAGQCGLFVRKCATPEPLYVEFFNEKFYGGFRYIVAPGIYADVTKIPVLNGGVIAHDSIQSMRIPPGLQVTLYLDTNFGGPARNFGPGSYPSLADFPTGNKTVDKTWDGEASSMEILSATW